MPVVLVSRYHHWVPVFEQAPASVKVVLRHCRVTIVWFVARFSSMMTRLLGFVPVPSYV